MELQRSHLGVIKAKGNKDLNDGKRVELEFNSRSQVIGQYYASFSSFLGCTARRMVPYNVKNWSDLDQEFVDQIWSISSQVNESIS